MKGQDVSLKGVHIVFISLAVGAMIFFGLWALNDLPALAFSVFGLAVALALYGFLFYLKVNP